MCPHIFCHLGMGEALVTLIDSTSSTSRAADSAEEEAVAAQTTDTNDPSSDQLSSRMTV